MTGDRALLGSLVVWLRAQLDLIELSDWHERRCQTHRAMPPNSPLGLGGTPMSCNCSVPEWLLADVDAKRRILDEVDILTGSSDLGRQAIGEDIARAMSLPFADRPGYLDEWRV